MSKSPSAPTGAVALEGQWDAPMEAWERADLSLEAWEMSRAISAHRLVTIAQLRRLIGKDPRYRLRELVSAGLVTKRTDPRCYESTPEEIRRFHPDADPVPIGEEQQWLWETNLCLPLLDFARPRGAQVVWHRSDSSSYDLGVSPAGHQPPTRWAEPHSSVDHAMLPMAIKYMRSSRISGETLGWAERARRSLYEQNQWRGHFEQPPVLVMMLRGYALKNTTLVEYARKWRGVLTATVPGSGHSQWNLFGSTPEVLICEDKSLMRDGPSAQVVNLMRWQIGRMWYDPPVEAQAA